jgi:hypothetical protein
VSPKHQLIACAILTLQIAGRSTYACAESRNEIHGQVCAGASGSAATDNHPIAGMVVEALGSDDKVIATAVTSTDVAGRFSIVVPVEVKAYHLMVYDRDANYWVFRPKGAQINDRHPMDLGQVLLYPRTTKLTADEAFEQFEGARFIQSTDKPAGELAMRRLTSDYPDTAKPDTVKKVYMVQYSADGKRIASSTDTTVTTVGRWPQKLPLTAALVLTPEFCATVNKKKSEKLKVGKTACNDLEPALKGIFTSLTRVDDPSKTGDAQVVLEPKFAAVATNEANFAFSNRELVVLVEWTVRDQSGKAIWIETVQGTAKRQFANAFTYGSNSLQHIVDGSVQDLAEQSAAKMSSAPELRNLSAPPDK